MQGPQQNVESEAKAERAASHVDLHEWRRLLRRRVLRQQLARFLTLNPVAWFFDEGPPQDWYHFDPSIRRSTRQNARYHWFRQRTGWTFLSHLGTTTGVRFAAIAGLVSAVFQAAPALGSHSPVASAFRWLLIAGGMYLLAAIWFELFCPLLLKQMLKSRDAPLGLHGRRWLRALVEDELRRWWQKRTWMPQIEMLDPSRREDRTALGIMSGYGVPVFCGFGVEACAQIDQALSEFAATQKIRLWAGNLRKDQRLEPYSAGYGFEGNRPWVRTLRIGRPDADQRLESDPAMVGARDLTVEWCRAPLGIAHHSPTRRSIDLARDVEGLELLFENDADARTFATIVGGWQDTLHPIRRALLFSLYIASLLSFVIFVGLQVRTVMNGLWPL